MRLPNWKKSLWYQLVLIVLLLASCNLFIICKVLVFSGYLSALLVITSIIFIVSFLIYPCRNEKNKRLKVLYGGYRVFSITAWSLCIEAVGYIIVILRGNLEWQVLLINIGIVLAIYFLLLASGMVRMLVTSKQIGILWTVLFLVLWYIPVVHLFLFKKICHKVRIEYIMTHERNELEKTRKEKEICNTQYPLLMVHGVFFRDWQFFNYWGRIPSALIKNH